MPIDINDFSQDNLNQGDKSPDFPHLTIKDARIIKALMHLSFAIDGLYRKDELSAEEQEKAADSTRAARRELYLVLYKDQEGLDGKIDASFDKMMEKTDD